MYPLSDEILTKPVAWGLCLPTNHPFLTSRKCEYYSVRRVSSRTSAPTVSVAMRIITEGFDLLRGSGALVSFAILILRLRVSRVRKPFHFPRALPSSPIHPVPRAVNVIRVARLAHARARAEILTARDKRISIKRAVLPTSPGCLHKFPASLFPAALALSLSAIPRVIRA